ncbi:MAG: hypothetical protein ACI8T1_005445 [Verrucomicrobiales bacterium]|jgi:hypothetical protein
MVAALGVAKRPVPNYLQALSDTYLPPAKTAQVAFAMHCFWTGEMKLGQLEGVLTTEAGWIEGHEVTLVHYDPARVSLQALVKKAHTDSCAAHVYLGKADQKLKVPQERVSVVDLSQAYRKPRASDQKRQLQGTVFARISLSPKQSTKVNAWCRVNQEEARSWLSPSQVALLEKR